MSGVMKCTIRKRKFPYTKEKIAMKLNKVIIYSIIKIDMCTLRMK